MKSLVLQKSKTGFIAAALFLLAFLGVLAWIFFVASKNPADSGESGILLLPFAVPWVMWLPVEWLGPWAAVLCVLLNAVIIYVLFGGLRLKTRV
ncbi:hypothetical protein ACFL33_05335 [Pseudomonadota bacterium]|jgi:hypothetical protein|nr:hypothetical protein [Xanthomonadales bacterium]